MFKNKEEFAKELYEFLENNNALGELTYMSREDAIGELTEYLSDPESIKDTLSDIEEIANEFDDYEIYVSEIRPLANVLESLLETLETGRDKRMVAGTGYEVKQAIRLGDKEILLAENMNEPEGRYYMKAEYTDNGLIGQYAHIIYSSSYLAVLEEFIGAVDQEIVALRGEFDKADYQSKPITADKCHPHDYGQNLVGKVVAIKPEALRPEYRRGDVQLVLVDGGFGANGNARGSAVFCYHLNDGKHTRFERHDILGEIKELPDWAKERLAATEAEREAKQNPPQADAPEVVAGYTILERVGVGDKTFVLGHNPGNPSAPYVTWQSMDGREGYDIGHYLTTREKAIRDLRARADKERYNQGSDRAKRSRDDAR